MSGPTDQELDESVASVLRLGVSLAAVIVAVGGLLLVRASWSAVVDYGQFHTPGPALQTLPGIVRSAMHLSPAGVIQLGIVLLIATPVARVVLCVVGFARQRDRLYVGISVLVLGVLLYSLLKGTL